MDDIASLLEVTADVKKSLALWRTQQIQGDTESYLDSLALTCTYADNAARRNFFKRKIEAEQPLRDSFNNNVGALKAKVPQVIPSRKALEKFDEVCRINGGLNLWVVAALAIEYEKVLLVSVHCAARIAADVYLRTPVCQWKSELR